MIISFLVFVSFFSFLNYSTKSSGKINISPFSFPLICFAVWEFFVLILYSFNVNYSILFFLFTICYIFVIIFFFSYYLGAFISLLKNKNSLVPFFTNLFYLFILVFFIIFLLFYHKNDNPFQTDQHFYYYLMQSYSDNGVYSIPKTYAQYSIVGMYQFGTTLDFENRFLLMPYLTMFFYFYIIVTSLNTILRRFTNKEWIMIVLLIFVSLCFFCIYFFIDTSIYDTLVGNISSSYLLGLLVVPSFLSNYKWKNYEILLFFFSFLFYSETVILVLPVYLVSFIIYLFLVSKWKVNIKISLIAFMMLLFSAFLLVAEIFALKNDAEILKFIPYFFIISLLIICAITLTFSFILPNLNSRNFVVINKNVNFHTTDTFFWFNQKFKIWIFFKWLIFYCCLIFLYFEIFGFQNIFQIDYNVWSEFLTAYSFITYILVVPLLYKSFKNKLHFDFFIFFLVILFISFFVWLFCHSYGLYYNGIITRFAYIGLRISLGSSGFIHNLVLFLLFYLFLYNRRKNDINRKNNSFVRLSTKRKMKYSLIAASGVFVGFTSINAIVYSEITDNNIIFSLTSLTNNFYYGLNIKTLDRLNSFNFKNKLTFSDIPLPTINDSSMFNVPHYLFGLYSTTAEFLDSLVSFKVFKNLENNTIQIYNKITISSDILPYYNYVVIRKNDTFFYDILNLSKNFKLIDNINNQVLIYQNIDLNFDNQKKFEMYNNLNF